MKLYIDVERCKACELCIFYCPKKVLKLDSEKFNKSGYNPVKLTDEKNCNLCGICYTVCPDCVFEIR